LVNRPFIAETATFTTSVNNTPLNIQTHDIPESERRKYIDDTFSYSNGFFVPGFAPSGLYTVIVVISGKDAKENRNQPEELGEASETI